MGHDPDRGQEATIRNIVYSKLSPFELSVTRSIIWSAKTVPRRVRRQALWFIIRKYYRKLVFNSRLLDWIFLKLFNVKFPSDSFVANRLSANLAQIFQFAIILDDQV